MKANGTAHEPWSRMRKETLLDTEPMLHKTQSKESVKEWLEKTMDRLLRHGRRWMFVIGDGSTVLGLLHEDKINHEAAMDLLIRLLGLETEPRVGMDKSQECKRLS